MKLVDAKLAIFERYNKYELNLNEEETSGFGTNLSLTCKDCSKEKSLLLQKIWRMKRYLDSKLLDYEKDRKLRRKYQNQLYYEEKTYEKLVLTHLRLR